MQGENFILCDELFVGNVIVVGLGALILNDLSYHSMEVICLYYLRVVVGIV